MRHQQVRRVRQAMSLKSRRNPHRCTRQMRMSQTRILEQVRQLEMNHLLRCPLVLVQLVLVRNLQILNLNLSLILLLVPLSQSHPNHQLERGLSRRCRQHHQLVLQEQAWALERR